MPSAPPLGDPEPIVEAAGGLLGEIVRWITATAIYPQPALALAAALAAVGTAAGRRYAGPIDIRTNVYLIGISPSGTGKEHQFTCLNSAFHAADLLDYLAGEEIASGVAVESTMARRAVQLFTIDEFGHFMKSVFNPRATSSHRRDIQTKLTKYTGSANRFVKGTEYANKKERERVDCYQPCLSIYATTVAEPFWEAFGSGALRDGSVARYLCFDGGLVKRQRPEGSPRDVPEAVVKGLRMAVAGEGWADAFAFSAARAVALDAQRQPQPLEVPLAPDAAELFEQLADEQDAMKASYVGSPFEPVAGRWFEHVNRIALIQAISDSPASPTIASSNLTWARAVVDRCFALLVREAEDHIADNEHEAMIKRVLRIIREHGRMTGNELSRRTQFLDMKQRREVVSQLEETFLIKVTRRTLGGGGAGYVVEPRFSSE